MENQISLFKGELMEELLRNYFLNLGFYVTRGVKLRIGNNDLTDIDLLLYGKVSNFTRQRINVDIKNKKSPQALERIVWANGLMKILNFDSCIVATTDIRPVIHSFAKKHITTLLDGNFLQKLKENTPSNRLSEEDILCEFSKYNYNSRTNTNSDWRSIYEISKSRLLTQLDYSGFNSSVLLLQYFFDHYISDKQKWENSLRMTYLILSHVLIIMDFILKDMAFLDQKEKEKQLYEGLKYGNIGKTGVDKIIAVASKISGKSFSSVINNSLSEAPVEILEEFFSKTANTVNLFDYAIEFENLGFIKNIIPPSQIASNLKGILSVFLDYLNIERKKYFDTSPL